LEFLTDSEINNLYTPIEYKNFIKSFYDLHVPEMMYLYQELTKLNVYDHSCAVNHFALNIGRQLLKAGIPVDLGNVSGAAVAHNLGQIACKDSLYEKSNIHFNTKIWFENSNAPLIGHIAMYNSIWDLESEILPLESLILIYSNFRINNKNPIQILPLEVSYNNLLSRLRNSDEALINRFKKAHNRLADFESYLKHLGIQVDMPSKDISNNPLNNYFTLMHGNEIIENLKYQALEHNIHLMFRLRNIDTLNSMIEAAKNSPYSNTLKNILNIFEEYSTFFTQQQKTTILLFLYDLLVHPEEDIRNRSAKLMGIIIGSFDGEFIGKIPENPLAADPSAKSHELFEKYLNNIISPDYKITGLHKDRLGDCLKTMVDSLFNKLDKANITDYRDIIIKYFKEISGYDLITQHHLLQAIKFVPWDNCTEENTDILTSILIHSLQSEYMDIRLISLDAIDCLLNVLSDYFKDKISAIIKDFYQKNAPLSERYLIYKIMCKLKLYENNSETFNKFFLDDISNLSEIYLTNLKSSTSWISKKIHIDFMLNESLCTANNDVFYTAMHFCNLIRISSNESVRINAGRALLDIMPQLSAVQKNDIAIELLRSLEIEGFELASHIPEYLGQVLLYLNPNEFDEQIHEFNIKIKR
ncbi:MAG: cytidyltransferase, partial [Candidatus Methanofastidiosa archaeon]|nr:cytidyltransferase [Candidatus Methanofastidiosa archaeon]